MEARERFLDLDIVVTAKTNQALRDAYFEIEDILLSLEGKAEAGIRREKWRLLQKDIGRLTGELAQNIDDIVVDGMTLAAQVAVDGKVKAGGALASGSTADLLNLFYGQNLKIFSTVSADAVKVVATRRLSDGKLFSDRIWALKEHTEGTLSRIVAKDIALGKSARETAKDVAPYLITSQDEWKQVDRVLDHPGRGVGSAKYNAMRLAKTEINHAHHEASIISADIAPWVAGVRWNLGSSHIVYDICDQWASQNHYGLGRGVFPPGETPIDHPNGWCWLTDSLIPPSMMGDVLKRFSKGETAGDISRIVSDRLKIQPEFSI